MIATAVGISLGVGCSEACDEFSRPLLEQMGSGKYDECAVMPLPRSVRDWEAEHRTARKRAWKAERLGFRFAFIRRAACTDDIHAINISRPHRQGRPMANGYRTRPAYPLDDYPCRLHGVHCYGVQDDGGTLVAYMFVYRAGELALVSQVLGHGDFEEYGIMYLLFREALVWESVIAPGLCVYNRYDSGEDGLRFLKDRIGFEPTGVEWLP